MKIVQKYSLIASLVILTNAPHINATEPADPLTAFVRDRAQKITALSAGTALDWALFSYECLANPGIAFSRNNCAKAAGIRYSECFALQKIAALTTGLATKLVLDAIPTLDDNSIIVAPVCAAGTGYLAYKLAKAQPIAPAVSTKRKKAQQPEKKHFSYVPHVRVFVAGALSHLGTKTFYQDSLFKRTVISGIHFGIALALCPYLEKSPEEREELKDSARQLLETARTAYNTGRALSSQ